MCHDISSHVPVTPSIEAIRMILPSVESLWSPLQDKVYFVGGDAAGGLWRQQQWSPSWIYQELEIKLKPREMVIFLCLRWKIAHKQALPMILATRFICIVKKSRKNVYFRSKVAWTPPTYDVLSRNHRNWTSLNLTQNVREGWKNSYWKHQVLMFYPLGENSEKP